MLGPTALIRTFSDGIARIALSIKLGSVAAAAADALGLPARIMIDASHAKWGKNPDNQSGVVGAVAAQIAAGDRRFVGVMVESNLVAGRQDLRPDRPLVYGQSVTDGCIDWATTVPVLEGLAGAARRRRAAGYRARA